MRKGVWTLFECLDLSTHPQSLLTLSKVWCRAALVWRFGPGFEPIPQRATRKLGKGNWCEIFHKNTRLVCSSFSRSKGFGPFLHPNKLMTLAGTFLKLVIEKRVSPPPLRWETYQIYQQNNVHKVSAKHFVSGVDPSDHLPQNLPRVSTRLVALLGVDHVYDWVIEERGARVEPFRVVIRLAYVSRDVVFVE